MSHEIRTPINAVLGMDEMILRECGDEAILGYAANIQSAGQLLLAVINDVLDFSKIESGKLELIPVEYNVHQLMNSCYNIIINRAEKKNLLLEIQNDPELPSGLIGDEIRIRQMIINLLTNAVKYTVAGKVTMSLGFKKISEKMISLKVSIRDTGMGISPENQRELFSDFNRLDSLKTRNIEGTGLGLSITKRLAKLMEQSAWKVRLEWARSFGLKYRRRLLRTSPRASLRKIGAILPKRAGNTTSCFRRPPRVFLSWTTLS